MFRASHTLQGQEVPLDASTTEVSIRPEGAQACSRGQSGAAPPDGGPDMILKPRQGRRQLPCLDAAAALSGLGRMCGHLPRGRRACGALTPGYMPEPLRGTPQARCHPGALPPMQRIQQASPAYSRQGLRRAVRRPANKPAVRPNPADHLDVQWSPWRPQETP